MPDVKTIHPTTEVGQPHILEFKTGAKRQLFTPRYDLICPTAVETYALVCNEGQLKYGERNWEKGIPIADLINHAVGHLMEFMKHNAFDATHPVEDHLGHALWNIAAAIHFRQGCYHHLQQEDKHE